MNPAALLRVDRLCAGYGGNNVLWDISFELNSGETLCIVGESGSGKSTLLRALLGRDPSVKISAGEIYLAGEELTGLPKKKRGAICAENFGMIFQTPGASFNPIRSYKKQFVEVLKSHGRFNAGSFMSDVSQVFTRLELGDAGAILPGYPYEMSGGMNQRISIALVLLTGQRILLADEPTSALDATIQFQVAQELNKLRDEKGVAQIIVTHNLALAQFLADRIAVIHKGRIVEHGTAEQIIRSPGHDYTRALLAAVPHLGGSL